MMGINQLRLLSAQPSRRSASSLGDLFALTGPACSETMLAWISTSLAT